MCALAALLCSGAVVASADAGRAALPAAGAPPSPDNGTPPKIGAAWRVPAAVREIDISSGVARQPPTIRLTVSRPSLVTRVVKLFNSFTAAPMVMYMCPMLTDPKLITITFRSSTGESLAVATYQDFKPWNGPSGPCKAVELMVGHGHERALVGGYFLRTLERMLGRSLT